MGEVDGLPFQPAGQLFPHKAGIPVCILHQAKNQQLGPLGAGGGRRRSKAGGNGRRRMNREVMAGDGPWPDLDGVGSRA